eukprot:TRINITY_DN739_c0_g1_i8.p2 TRINITY_DN739_c0_g1~~TRINITY_DN739_c0_g1_i8.p2  ORF type:complete len:235 (-),score=13.72 TRINITY_DN739_c0_g1_i8:772-1410(-)
MLRLLVLASLVACTLQACTCGGPCYCWPLENKAKLLSLPNTQESDWALFWMGRNGLLGDCKVSDSRNSGSFCDFYVTSSIHGQGSYKGYPLNTDCRGTGCVKAPDYPKGISTCWYSQAEYGGAINQISNIFCTEDGIANGAAMLRHAIQNDACNCQVTSEALTNFPAEMYVDDPSQAPGYYTEAQFVSGDTTASVSVGTALPAGVGAVAAFP